MFIDRQELSILARARDDAVRALAAVPRIPADVWKSMMRAQEQIEAARPALQRFASDMALTTELAARYEATAPVGSLYSQVRSPAYLTGGVTEPVYVPEDDPVALKKELGEKDEQIAELLAELRAVRFALALDGVEYADDLEPGDFSQN